MDRIQSLKLCINVLKDIEAFLFSINKTELAKSVRELILKFQDELM